MENIRKKFLNKQNLWFKFLVCVGSIKLCLEKRTDNFYLVKYYTRLWHPVSILTIIFTTWLLLFIDVIKTIYDTVDSQVKYYIDSGKITTEHFDL